MTSRAEFRPISEIVRKETVIVALRRIERKAEIMRTDALRGVVEDKVRAGDAEEIRLLAQIALRNVGEPE